MARLQPRTPTSRSYRIRPLTPKPPSEVVDQKRSWRAVVRGWVAEESFWRDVTTRTIAAAIVGVGAYLYALGAGYLSTPSGSQAMKGVLNLVVWPVVGFSIVWIAEVISRRLRKSRYPKLADIIESLPVLLMLLAVLLALIHLFVWELPFWPFNRPGWHAGTPRLF